MTDRNTDVLGRFSTPIWVGRVKEHEQLNKSLLKYINEIRKKDPQGTKKSNILGWHSPDFDLKDESIKNFFDKISPMIKDVTQDMMWDLEKFAVKILSCWSIVNNKFASNAGHIHANSLISSAYYVSVNKDSGKIIFDDPRPGATIKKGPYTNITKWNEGNVTVEPENGLLVMFPSYLVHHVQPNMSDQERVIISFNIDVSNK